MKFKTVAEAFNFYRTKEVAEMERRAQEIGHIIDTDENADIEALNIELRGIKEARENIELRSYTPAQGLNVITGMNTEPQGKKTFGDDVLDTPEYRSAFFKKLLGKDLTDPENRAYSAAQAEKRSDSFNTLSNSAAVIPTYFPYPTSLPQKSTAA